MRARQARSKPARAPACNSQACGSVFVSPSALSLRGLREYMEPSAFKQHGSRGAARDLEVLQRTRGGRERQVHPASEGAKRYKRRAWLASEKEARKG
jgi:hypothetical protein